MSSTGRRILAEWAIDKYLNHEYTLTELAAETDRTSAFFWCLLREYGISEETRKKPRPARKRLAEQIIEKIASTRKQQEELVSPKSRQMLPSFVCLPDFSARAGRIEEVVHFLRGDSLPSWLAGPCGEKTLPRPEVAEWMRPHKKDVDDVLGVYWLHTWQPDCAIAQVKWAEDKAQKILESLYLTFGQF